MPIVVYGGETKPVTLKKITLFEGIEGTVVHIWVEKKENVRRLVHEERVREIHYEFEEELTIKENTCNT